MTAEKEEQTYALAVPTPKHEKSRLLGQAAFHFRSDTIQNAAATVL